MAQAKIIARPALTEEGAPAVALLVNGQGVIISVEDAEVLMETLRESLEVMDEALDSINRRMVKR